ncbi:integrase [Halobacteriales archaeon QH_3_68_24]|nr:MAG: integrase [Halobacteriales archaeon QH_3_68_24]
MSSESRRDAAAGDPVGYFLEDITFQGKSQRTKDAYERVLREFESYLEGRGLGLAEANHRDCMAWIHQLRGEVGEATVATYASYLHRFYAYMTEVGTFEDNPMGLVMEEIDESIATDPQRRDLSVPAMRSFVASVTHPLDRAVVLTLLKTGMRTGELCNLDLRDLYLPGAETGVDHRPQLDGKPDSIHVPAEPAQGETYNGQRRLTPHMVHHVVETHAREQGWYREGGGAEENVTPHYFRHFFTTHLRDRTGDRGVVKFLRGDVATDVIDTYTHDWGDRVREMYEASIYRLARY